MPRSSKAKKTAERKSAKKSVTFSAKVFFVRASQTARVKKTKARSEAIRTFFDVD